MRTFILIRFDNQVRPSITKALQPFCVDNPVFLATQTTLITIFNSEEEGTTIGAAIEATGDAKGIMGFILLPLDPDSNFHLMLPPQIVGTIHAYLQGQSPESGTLQRQRAGRVTRPGSSAPEVQNLSNEEHLNLLLDKVSKSGYDSLNAGEKADLARLSQ